MLAKMFRALEVAVLAVITLAMGAAVLVMFPSLKSEVAAAWVQAVGSIAAIAVAIWIPYAQHQKELAAAAVAQRESRKSLRYRLNLMSMELVTLLRSHEEKLSSEGSIAIFDEVGFTDFLQRLAQFQNQELGIKADVLIHEMRSIVTHVFRATQTESWGGKILRGTHRHSFNSWINRALQVSKKTKAWIN